MDLLLIPLLLVWAAVANAANPLVSGVGMADPHVHVWPDGRFYMYATHDFALNSSTFVMDNWWVWTSPDLVQWTEESVVWPSQTPLRANYSSCWATDGAFNGSAYAFYLSLGPNDVGVMVSPTPVGPWSDPLGVPLLPAGSVATTIRDPGVLKDTDGSFYIIFGVWQYFIAKLGPDMITLAESPKPVVVSPQDGPYGPGKLDDKPFLHRVGTVYILSWGCYYGIGTSPYGPFQYQGAVLNPAYFGAGFTNQPGGWDQDRHGSFFSHNGQDYYVCNDRTHGATQYFRNSVMGYVHYNQNGTIAPIWINATGVNEFNLTADPRIEAEHYFSLVAPGARKQPGTRGSSSFEVLLWAGGGVVFTHVHAAPCVGNVTLRAWVVAAAGLVPVLRGRAGNVSLAECALVPQGDGEANGDANGLGDFFCAWDARFLAAVDGHCGRDHGERGTVYVARLEWTLHVEPTKGSAVVAAVVKGTPAAQEVEVGLDAFYFI